MRIILGYGIELDLNAYKFIIEEVAGLFLREDGRDHEPAGAAPGSEAVHENIFVLRLCPGLDGGPAAFMIEPDAFVLCDGQQG